MRSKQATVLTDLSAIRHNFELVQQLAPGSQVMAVIKADAYGHGAVTVAGALSAASALAVSRVSEAVQLREAGISGDICLLNGVMNREDLNLASIYELQVVVHAEEQLELLARAGARRNIWLKVDTGMGRLGFAPDQLRHVYERLTGQKLLGLMTHFACADDPGSKGTDDQLKRLQTVSQALKTVHPAFGVLSTSNSAAVMTHPESCLDWVRPGLMLYGASPMRDLQPDPSLAPAMRFTAPVIAVHDVKSGASVGYGGIWTATEDTRVAVIAAGYGDGYPREIEPGTQVLLGSERREIVGRVSMDLICIRLEPGDEAPVGEHVMLWGPGLPIEEIARSAGTIPYTLMCRISERVRRVVMGGRR